MMKCQQVPLQIEHWRAARASKRIGCVADAIPGAVEPMSVVLIDAIRVNREFERLSPWMLCDQHSHRRPECDRPIGHPYPTSRSSAVAWTCGPRLRPRHLDQSDQGVVELIGRRVRRVG